MSNIFDPKVIEDEISDFQEKSKSFSGESKKQLLKHYIEKGCRIPAVAVMAIVMAGIEDGIQLFHDVVPVGIRKAFWEEHPEWQDIQFRNIFISDAELLSL